MELVSSQTFTIGSCSDGLAVEYTPQAYIQTDLDMWFQNFSKPLVGKAPYPQIMIDGTHKQDIAPTALDPLLGGVVQHDAVEFDLNAESNLDLQFAMALSWPQNITLYQVGDIVEGYNHLLLP